MTEVFELSDKTRQSQVHLSELVSAANTYKGIYETFLARFTQTVQQQSFPSTEARVVAPASPPRVRSSPKTTLTLLLATIGGMALGLASAFVREQMRRQIHTRAQLEKLLGLSCLAVLPALGGKSSMLRRLRGKPHQGAFQQLSELPPFSATAEALRYIKVAIDIHFMRDKGDQPKGGKIIGLVSALPGEGKTTVAAGFAAFVAKTGARTLLIDADFRNPSLTRTLGRSGTRGLINIISENARFEDVVVSDATFKFDLVPSSTEIRTSNSSDVLNSPIMQELLRTARDSYEYVLVDLPPILPVVDVMAVAHLLDAFLLVVEWGSTPTDEILKAVKTSSLVAERLIGAILNKADETVMRRLEGYSDRRYGYYTK
jgi:capsular exopolysaccharide synthesis family protein